MRERRRSAALLLVLAAGCGGSAGAAAEDLVVDVRDSAGVRLVELRDPVTAVLPAWRVAREPVVRIGEVTGAPEYELFQALSAVRLADGTVAIANAGTSEIRLYDAAGRHVRTIGRSGSGPGEFNLVTWIGAAGGDTLVAFDVRLRRLTWLTPSGSVVHTQPLVATGGGGFPEAVGLLEGTFVARGGFDRQFGRGERRDTLVLYRFGADGSVSDTLGRYAGTERYFHATPEFSTQFAPLFGRDAHAHAAADRLVAGASDAYSFDVYAAGGLVLRVRAAHEAPRPTTAELERERGTRVRRGGGLPESIQEQMARAVTDIPARETLPAFAALRVDRTGAVWVRDYIADAARPQRWTVFGGDGAPRARVELPAGLDVYDIGADYVLGRTRDEDGVERILVLDLERG